MHIWNWWGSVPPTRLRSTVLMYFCQVNLFSSKLKKTTTLRPLLTLSPVVLLLLTFSHLLQLCNSISPPLFSLHLNKIFGFPLRCFHCQISTSAQFLRTSWLAARQPPLCMQLHCDSRSVAVPWRLEEGGGSGGRGWSHTLSVIIDS